ncbi:MAG: signal peptidase I [Gemmatimonadota bacterium]
MSRERRRGGRDSRSREERGKRRRAQTEADPKGGELLEWGKTLVLTVVFLVIIRTFLVQTFVITSGSMEDTLLVGDFLMVNRLALGTRLPGTDFTTPGYSEPQRGEVLVFDPPHEDGIKLVKRLVGMPGDTLEMRGKNLYIDGELQDEAYARWGDPTGDDQHPWMRWQAEHLVSGVDPAEYQPTRDNWGPLVVPEGHYFMLGDNRDFSLDSRYWGLLERWRLEGKAMFFYFSYDRESPAPFSFLREIRWDRIGDGIR